MAIFSLLAVFASLRGALGFERLIDPELRCPKGYYSVCDVEFPPTSRYASYKAAPSCWVAVLVDGVIGRFYPETTLQHVVRPLVASGCVVDYYVMLAGSLHEGGFSAYWYRPVNNPRFENMTWDAFEEYLLRRATRAGVRRAALYHHSDVALDSFPENSTWRRSFRGGRRASATFVRNVLYLQAVELLWNWTKSFGESQHYSHVALIRGDIYWLEDLRIDLFDPSGTAYSRSFGPLCTSGEGIGWPDDRVFVLGGDIAEQVLTAYSAFLYDETPELDLATVNEEFFNRLASVRGVRWKYVQRNFMAYFAAIHMQQPDREPFLCLRGLTRKVLLNPNGSCVHPSRVQLPFCEDSPLL